MPYTREQLTQIVHDAVVGVLRATEFQQVASVDARSLITQWYADLLGRPASPDELEKRVVASLSSRGLREQYADIYGSAEAVAYRKRIKG